MKKEVEKSSPNDQPLDFTNTDLRDFLISEAEKTEKKRDSNVDSVNRVELALCSQVMLISSVLFTGSIVWFSDIDKINTLTNLQKHSLLIAVFSLCFSIIAGIRYYFVLNHFFQKWGESEDQVSDIYRDREFKTWTEALQKINEARFGLPNTSSTTWLKIQIVALGISGVSFLTLVCGVLFDFWF